MKWLLVVIPVFLCVFLCVDSAITFSGPKCGTNICGVDQFCSKYHKQCENCDTICDSATHNFDNAMCTEQCQGTCVSFVHFVCALLEYSLNLISNLINQFPIITLSDYLHDIRYARSSVYSGKLPDSRDKTD